ncbi:hypothetical protein BGZ83_010413 [Gryganskiella cystojenkinii]|nr:hypothetical protein BGZ83_010413 [Gryganskiella cystojenkinii]
MIILRQQESQHFERIIASTAEKFNWDFSLDENPHEDIQDIACRDFAIKLVGMEIAEIGCNANGNIYQSMDDEPRSSPLEPEDWDSVSQVLHEMSDGFDVGSPEDMQYMRKSWRCLRMTQLH